MKYIQEIINWYKNLNSKSYHKKENIDSWLQLHHITNYKIIEDKIYGYVVDVDGDVHIESSGLTEIPVKFNYINGDFHCFNNNLTSLNFAPQKVDGEFDCSNNQLTSLEGCPSIVTEDFFCSKNNLKSLAFCPTKVGGHFYCSKNKELKEIQSVLDFPTIFLLHREHFVQEKMINLKDKIDDAIAPHVHLKTSRSKL